jgi:hypothetical protein
MAPFVFGARSDIFGSEKNNHYLHISSSRAKEKPGIFENNLENMSYLNTIVMGERVVDQGCLQRTYIGPTFSLQWAELNEKELERNKFIDYSTIHKKASLNLSDSGKAFELERKKDQNKPTKTVLEAAPHQELKPPVTRQPVKMSSAHEIRPEGEDLAALVSPIRRPKQKKQPLPAPETRPPEDIDKRLPLKKPRLPQRAKGRNTGQSNFALGLRHKYQIIRSELTKRERISSDGNTTTIEVVSLPDDEKDDFPMKLHTDSLYLKYGLTNFLDVFAESGIAYQDLSDRGFTYGGGLLLNLFEVKIGRLKGFYGSVQGEYLKGHLEHEFTSSSGNTWKEETDWEEFFAKGELGLARSWFALYLGGVYFRYHEDTERRLEDLPPTLTSFMFKDDLEKEDFGAFGGFVIHLLPKLLLNIEGQVFSQESILAAIEYRF